MPILANIVDNLMLKDWSQSEVEHALFEIDKPLKKITIADVSNHIEQNRKQGKTHDPKY